MEEVAVQNNGLGSGGNITVGRVLKTYLFIINVRTSSISTLYRNIKQYKCCDYSKYYVNII